MTELAPKFSYEATTSRENMWEEPVSVVNILEENGVPNYQQIKSNEITPKQAIDIDARALKQEKCLSIVFGRPHAGEYVPKAFLNRFNPEAWKTLTLIDRGTVDIFKSPTIPSVGTKFSRFIIDPNRSPLMEIAPENPAIKGKVLWYEGAFNDSIYKSGQEPNLAEVENLAEKFYLPYYRGMMSVIGSLLDRRKDPRERVLVIDGHSFPILDAFEDIYKKYGIEDQQNMPMFILGDGGGKTCDPDIIEAFTLALEKNFSALPEKIKQSLTNHIKGGLIGLNNPFKGVHNVQFYGQRVQGINSFQLECNEMAYLEDGDDYYKTKCNPKKIEIIKKLLEKTCQDIDPILKSKRQ